MSGNRVAIILLTLLLCSVLPSTVIAGDDSPPIPQWTDDFNLNACRFATTGSNSYFILQPGHQLILAGVDEGDSATLIITVLNETIVVDGVETRIVEERESKNGELIEVSRNFFAFCETNGSIFYFGEDVDMYDEGEITSHSGAWRAGADSARAGLMLPGLPLIGAAYYQEIAPGKAMDRARIISTTAVFECPAGRFEDCLITEETTPLEPDAREEKVYAPGIGLVKDGPLVLINCLNPGRSK
ncbi:MAG: hypothetical protein AB1752_12105 [Candidatus Zixiibacteriota bacterium]